MLSQFRLQASASAFDKGSCKRATSEAIASINILAIRPEPYQILGYCDMDSGQTHEALAAMRKAVAEQPRNWEFHYGLALAQGYSGIDPRPELAAARRLNPMNDLVATATQAFGATGPSGWPNVARGLESNARVSGELTLR
jgi:Flp pilus assembly protein TadD